MLDQQRQQYASISAALVTAKDGAEVQRSTHGKLRQELAAAASSNAVLRCIGSRSCSTALPRHIGHMHLPVTTDCHHAGRHVHSTCRANNERKQERLEVARRQLADVTAKCEAEARQLGDVVADDARLEAMLQVLLLAAVLRSGTLQAAGSCRLRRPCMMSRLQSGHFGLLPVNLFAMRQLPAGSCPKFVQ